MNYVWHVAGIAIAAALVIFVRSAMKANAKQQAENAKRIAEKNEAETKEREAMLKKLRTHPFVVYVREKDGRKCAFEAVLTRELLKNGIIVEPLPDSDGRAIAAGDMKPLRVETLALVGTAWNAAKTEYVTIDPMAGEGGYQKIERTHCDYRLLATTNGKATTIAAGYRQEQVHDQGWLARWIVEELLWATTRIPNQTVQS